MTSLFKLGFGFFLGLLILWEDLILDYDNIFDLSNYKLYLLCLVILPQHVFIMSTASVVLLWYLYFLYQLFCCSTFSLYVPCQLLYQLNLFYRSFLLYLLLRVSLLTQTNHYPAISIYIYTHIYLVSHVLQNIFYICICEYV